MDRGGFAKGMSVLPRETPNGSAKGNRSEPPEKFLEIDARREAAGVAAPTLCGRAGVAPSSWWRIKGGEVRPRRSTLAKLARALKLIERETLEIGD